MSAKVAVVVPYFQRESGILRKALESIFAQQKFEDYTIYVVDDESPMPADQDLTGFDTTRIELIRQKNKGCGGARNTAHAYGRPRDDRRAAVAG